jgi:hypothetical protein
MISVKIDDFIKNRSKHLKRKEGHKRGNRILDKAIRNLMLYPLRYKALVIQHILFAPDIFCFWVLDYLCVKSARGALYGFLLS